MAPSRRTSARGKSPGREAAAVKAPAVAPASVSTDYWWLYVAYCAAELACTCVMYESRPRVTQVCVLAVHFCLLLNARLMITEPGDVDIDEVMQLKNVYTPLSLAMHPGAALAVLDAALQWLPTPAVDGCAGMHAIFEMQCRHLAATQRADDTARLLWFLVTAAQLLSAVAWRDKWIPWLCFAGCACRGLA